MSSEGVRLSRLKKKRISVFTITPDEHARRRYAVEQANAHNRIEGIEPNPAADAIYALWIAGKIDSDEVTRRIHQISDFERQGKRAGRLWPKAETR
jgi:Antitoxin VbhA